MKGRRAFVFQGLVFVCLFLGFTAAKSGNNQTDQLNTVLPASSLPFRINIERTNMLLPVGNHSGVVGVYKGMWVIIAGSSFGLHGFGPDPFPPSAQNRTIFVVNPITNQIFSRSLEDSSSGLTRPQIDSLSVISAQAYQEADTLYMTGGYGVDSYSNTFSTKPLLTALYLPGIVRWVKGEPGQSVAQNIRQLSNPVFQIAGGEMFKLGSTTQLVFGQNFSGVYTGGSNGVYSNQVRRFQVRKIRNELAVDIFAPSIPNPNFRRRDLNIVPTIFNNNNMLEFGLVAFAGVFTLASGVWTVPVLIYENKPPFMANPNSATSFKQAMNQYVCATANLYSRRSSNMYTLFFGGMSFGYFDAGVFQTDAEIPFINQVTTVQMDKYGQFFQYIMDNQFPVIPSTGANPGNPLLFGSGAYFIPIHTIQKYQNGVINLDGIRGPTVIGYIVGGIQSTLANTNTDADSEASRYIFRVSLIPQ